MKFALYDFSEQARVEILKRILNLFTVITCAVVFSITVLRFGAN